MLTTEQDAARRDGRRPRRILIIKPSSLGDIVHALPVLDALRKAYPDAHIAWLVGSGFAQLLEGHPELDEIIPFDRAHFGKMWRSPRAWCDFWRFVWQVRSRRFDLVVDLQGLIRSGLLSLFSGARWRVGFAAAREGAWLLYSQRVRCPASATHAVDRNLTIAAALGLPAATPGFPLPISADERATAQQLLADAAGEESADYVAVLPGARWESKRWAAQRIAELIDRMHEAGLPRCVLLGGPDDRPIAAQIEAACRTGVINLVGRTSLRQLAALIARAERVVCHDSGPMHIAAALDKSTVAIFGPTDPDRTGPYSDNARVVTYPIECAPCLRRRCPLGHHDCMQQLSVEQVMSAIMADPAAGEGRLRPAAR